MFTVPCGAGGERRRRSFMQARGSCRLLRKVQSVEKRSAIGYTFCRILARSRGCCCLRFPTVFLPIPPLRQHSPHSHAYAIERHLTCGDQAALLHNCLSISGYVTRCEHIDPPACDTDRQRRDASVLSMYVASLAAMASQYGSKLEMSNGTAAAKPVSLPFDDTIGSLHVFMIHLRLPLCTSSE